MELVKDHPLKTGLASACILLFVTLQIWNHYDPLAVSNWNRSQISRIKVADPDDFTFAVFGDNKDGYLLFEKLLKDIDKRREVSFAIALGDLVPKGKGVYFRRFLKEVQAHLTIPLVTAIGNHDLNGGSSDNYRQIFGESYYSFTIGETHFIVLHATTEAGFDKMELSWLEEELKRGQGAKNRIVFMHIPPFDPRGEGFNKCLQDGKSLLDLFRYYHVTHLFAAHIHGYFSGVWEGVSYTITGGAGGKLQGDDPDHFFHHYVAVHVYKGKVDTTVRRIDVGVIQRLFDICEDSTLEWGLLLPPAIFLAGILLFIRRRTWFPL